MTSDQRAPEPGSPATGDLERTRESGWLDDDQQRAWRGLAGVLLRLPTALDSDMQHKARITHFEYLVLSALSEAPGRTLRMSELAAIANASLSRLSHAAARLENRAWIRRTACPEDGRFTNATLTDSGFAKVVASAPGHVETVRALVFDGLTTAEVDQLRAVTEHILARVGPGHADADPRHADADPRHADAGPGQPDARPTDEQ